MMKRFISLLLAPSLCLLLGGCSRAGGKAEGIGIIYALALTCSLILLIAYLFIFKGRNKWYYLLFSSVPTIQLGYFMLSVSKTLSMALWANRISYLGSVFLPLSMMMIIMQSLDFRYKKRLPATLLSISGIMFCITATPGILPVYYKEVSLVIENGTATLDKVYGPLHILYLLFLLGYFSAMIVALLHAVRLGRMQSIPYAGVLIWAVLSNLLVWLLEQFVHLDFELLSISYVLTELFLLCLYALRRAGEFSAAPIPSPPDQATLVQKKRIIALLPLLTPSERKIFDLYVEGKGTKEVLSTLYISENTLKFHNKNIYAKLGISSRKELIAIMTTPEA